MSQLRFPLIAFDIGGTLAKVVIKSDTKGAEYFSFEEDTDSLTIFQKGEEISLKCIKFPVHFVNDFVQKLKENGVNLGDHKIINATGEGTRKFSSLFQEMGIKLIIKNDVQCVIKGMNYLLLNSDNEIFMYKDKAQENVPHERFLNNDLNGVKFPYLLVNIGSGVSIFKVEDEREFHRISGSSIGGGTYHGLCKLLSRVRNKASKNSSSAKDVDLKVGDIYGQAYSSIGLNKETIASFFGNVSRFENYDDISLPDCMQSFLVMVAVNIGQIAWLNASCHDVETIFFCGSFMRNNPDFSPFFRETLAWAVEFWSGKKTDAFFLRHDGYLGALGAMLSSLDDDYFDDVVSYRRGFFSMSPAINTSLDCDSHQTSVYFDSVALQVPDLSYSSASTSLKDDNEFIEEDDLENSREDDFIDLGMLAPPHPIINIENLGKK